MAIRQAKTKSTLATSLSFPSNSSTRILGRKRVAVSPAPSPSGPHSPVRTLRKQRSIRFHMDDTVSLLESLPQDVLIKVLCKVDYSDLRQLLLVSKQVSEATLVAKEQHFAFATPKKAAVRGDDDEAPWAPKQRRVAGWPICRKDMASVSVNLFDSFMSEV
uniref:F-box domain-containing protein n=1 Tax=Leersia perrieri TaxID=77586 RepID=A0A0D9X0B4_9ORYZ